MNSLEKKILTFLRKTHTFFSPTLNKIDIMGQDLVQYDIDKDTVQTLISNAILNRKPFMVGRLGTEFYALLNWREVHLPKMEYVRKFITRELYYPEWNKDIQFNLCRNTGFFPMDTMSIEQYCSATYSLLSQADLWLFFNNVEVLFNKELVYSVKAAYPDVEPYFSEHPWTESLKGKKVLVIHPFAKTIEKQYVRRQLIWENKNILPDFELSTITAVQTIAFNQTEFKTWFDALNSMISKMRDTDFDVLVVGAGAYSLHLVAAAKQMGKVGIYMGGATQIWFGIKGKRWDDMPEISKFYNPYWVRPSEEEIVPNQKTIEDGCYW